MKIGKTHNKNKSKRTFNQIWPKSKAAWNEQLTSNIIQQRLERSQPNFESRALYILLSAILTIMN